MGVVLLQEPEFHAEIRREDRRENRERKKAEEAARGRSKYSGSESLFFSAYLCGPLCVKLFSL
jgi:hypothetical protein